MIVYRMSRIFVDRDDPTLPTTEFNAQFNRAGWTEDGTLASMAFASFEDLQAHMNNQFSQFTDKKVAEDWKRNNPSSPYPLAVFVNSDWVIEWSDPDFRPLDEFDESDAKAAAERLTEML